MKTGGDIARLVENTDEISKACYALFVTSRCVVGRAASSKKLDTR